MNWIANAAAEQFQKDMAGMTWLKDNALRDFREVRWWGGGLLKAAVKDKLMKSHRVKDKKAKEEGKEEDVFGEDKGGLGRRLCIITFSVLSSIGNQ